MVFEAKGAEPAAGAWAETTLSKAGSVEMDVGKDWLLLGVRV